MIGLRIRGALNIKTVGIINIKLKKGKRKIDTLLSIIGANINRIMRKKKDCMCILVMLKV